MILVFFKLFCGCFSSGKFGGSLFFLNCLAGMSLENLWKRGRFMFYPKIGRLRKNKATKIMQMGVGETRRCCQSCFGNHLV